MKEFDTIKKMEDSCYYKYSGTISSKDGSGYEYTLCRNGNFLSEHSLLISTMLFLITFLSIYFMKFIDNIFKSGK